MKVRMNITCTAILISINVAVFLVLNMLGNTEDAYFMMSHGAMYEPLIIENQEYYRIITSMFLHFGIQHLANNMVMLGALGWNLEQEIGKIKLLFLYFVSGIGGNILSIAFGIKNQEYAVSAGASGAVYGLMGALLYVVIANHGRLGRLSGKGMFGMVILSLYFGLTGSGIDNLAHIGGLASGFLLAVLLYHRDAPDVDSFMQEE